MKFIKMVAGGVGAVALTTSIALAAPKPEDFIKSGIEGDNSEIALGQMAEQKGSTQQLRSYGQTLVTDHTQAKQQKSALATQLKVQPSDAVKPEASAIQAKLSKLSGLDFDRAFVAAMIDDHQKDIADFQAEARDNNGPASALAGQQLPVLQKHLQMALDIQKSESGAAAGKSATPAEGFLAQQPEGVWRGSKLSGVDIYGPDNRKVGSISDVLVDQSGKITHVVVGVGGFLGIGEKDVAIPFEKVNFSQTPLPSQGIADRTQPAPQNTAPTPSSKSGANPGAGGVNPNGAEPPNAGLGAPVGMTPGTGAGAGTSSKPPGTPDDTALRPRSNAYPDHGTVDYTADQLKSAPTFTYAK